MDRNEYAESTIRDVAPEYPPDTPERPEEAPQDPGIETPESRDGNALDEDDSEENQDDEDDDLPF